MLFFVFFFLPSFFFFNTKTVLAYMEICSASTQRHTIHDYNLNRNITHSQTMKYDPSFNYVFENFNYFCFDFFLVLRQHLPKKNCKRFHLHYHRKTISNGRIQLQRRRRHRHRPYHHLPLLQHLRLVRNRNI